MIPLKKYLPVVLGATISVVFFACTPAREKMNQQISEMESGLINDTTYVPDKVKAEKVIQLYDEYAVKYPDDTLSASYLFKAGDISSKINNTAAAIEYFDRLKTKYPNHVNAPYAIFLQGFIYENQVGDPAKAKPYYEEFLKKHPDHVIAGDVARSISDLGKTPDELVAGFDKKMEADSAAAADSTGITVK